MAGKNWHNLDFKEVAQILKTDIKEGLSRREVKIRQEKFGKNLLPEEKPLSQLRIFLEQFKSPLIYILVIAGIITLAFKDYTDAIVIFGAVFLNTLVGFFQENKTSKILHELKKAVTVKTYVIRDENEKEIEQSETVPGDIILLRPGDKVPADGRLIDAYNLKINEASLTGEWIPAEKKIEVLPKEIPLADRDNMAYMGCVVEDGRGKAIVTETGVNTEIGKLAMIVKETEEEKTPYQKRIIHLGKIIGILIIIISLLIFGFSILMDRDIFQMFLTSVAMAVAAIPEGLPVAITVILALGMQKILKKKGLVRRMTAAETLGSTSIILTDKTGTLTEARMEVAGIYTYHQIFNDRQAGINNEAKLLALKIAILGSEAFIENPRESMGKWIIRGKPTEKALLVAGIQAGLDKKQLEETEPTIADFHFDPLYKYSATLHKISPKHPEVQPSVDYGARNILYVLGAPEAILRKSKFIDIDGKEETLTIRKIGELNRKVENLAEKGQRVLATAYKKTTQLTIDSQQLLIDDLVLVGLITIHDPLRKEVKGAIEICQKAGMRPIIVTGDHRLTARAIAKELGLVVKEENIIEGTDLDKISEEEFKKRLANIEIYARVEPRQKLRIAKAWQERGEVVAMTGDGVNDAPALKKADIGLALGSGTDVAKEASDLILLTDNFSIIVVAVEEGRQIIDNIRKVITYLLSDSFTEVILIGASVFAKLPLPILPAQILWVNLIEDSLPALGLSFEEKEKGIMERKPENPKSPILTREMKALIFAIGIFTDLLLLGLFLWLISKKIPLAEIRTIIFAGLAIDSLFYVFSCKDLRRNIWQINIFSNKILLFSWFWGIGMLLLAIYTPFFQNLLKIQPLNLFDWVLILGLGIINLILIEATKWYFITKRKSLINHPKI